MTAYNPYPDDANWPSAWNGCRLLGQFIGSDGQPLAGATITLTPAPSVVFCGNIILPPRQLTLTLDDDGMLDAIVPSTDSPNITPTGWTYTASEDWDGGRTYPLEAPDGVAAQVSNLIPIGTFAGVLIAKGDPGAQGEQGEDGPAGPGFTFRGAWSSGTTYAVLDVVEFGGIVFVAVQASTNQQPDTGAATSYWAFASGASGGGTSPTASSDGEGGLTLTPGTGLAIASGTDGGLTLTPSGSQVVSDGQGTLTIDL